MGRRWAPTIDYFSRVINDLLLEQWSNHCQRPSAGTMGSGGHRRPTTSLVIIDDLLEQWSDDGR